MPGPSGDIDPQVAGLIRLVVLDVDGVLTDGGIYVGVWPGKDPIEPQTFRHPGWSGGQDAPLGRDRGRDCFRTRLGGHGMACRRTRG